MRHGRRQLIFDQRFLSVQSRLATQWRVEIDAAGLRATATSVNDVAIRRNKASDILRKSNRVTRNDARLRLRREKRRDKTRHDVIGTRPQRSRRNQSQADILLSTRYNQTLSLSTGLRKASVSKTKKMLVKCRKICGISYFSSTTLR